ncbi:unnamed protein product [Sphenostylis stenocarpa]|uniref:Uncharacterized protein n=1 Tax=Sphenostylis stenocarpa TaxID=92480 RepID=A0AA86SM24_9FABA|nr:unnamed protein product [Sphenostylis stenocarpa]
MHVNPSFRILLHNGVDPSSDEGYSFVVELILLTVDMEVLSSVYSFATELILRTMYGTLSSRCPFFLWWLILLIEKVVAAYYSCSCADSMGSSCV